MQTNKYRILKISAVICFIIAFLEFGLATLLITTSNSDEYVLSFSKNIGIENNFDEITEEDFILVLKVIFGICICIEAIFFIIEGALIYRVIKKGKTTLILILVLIGILGQLLSLISVAIQNSYDFNSATDLISLIIKILILKQIFEIRRLNSLI